MTLGMSTLYIMTLSLMNLGTTYIETQHNNTNALPVAESGHTTYGIFKALLSVVILNVTMLKCYFDKFHNAEIA
jgi:hypothetical protein